MFFNLLVSAWRSLSKNATSTAINICGLAIGMSAAVLIFLWVRTETSFDSGNESENVYRLGTRLPEAGWVWETTPLLFGPAIQKQVPEVQAVVRLNPNNWAVFHVGNEVFYEREGAFVDPEWFSFFPYHFVAGNAANFAANPFSLILTSSSARHYFGNTNVVGKSIHVDSLDYVISGVVEDPALNSSFQYKSFMPMAALLSNANTRRNDSSWGNDNYLTFIRAHAGVQPQILAKKLVAVRKNASGTETPTDMVPLRDMHFNMDADQSIFVRGNKTTVYIFSVIGFLLLLIACINYVNLTTARASLRAKEVSIRKINGANRLQLFLQFATESLFVSLAAILATLIIVKLALPSFDRFTGQDFSGSFSTSNLFMVTGLTLFCAFVLNSVYPALLLSSFNPMQVFRGKTLLKMSDAAFRKSMVVLQFTVSVVLMAGTVIIYQQMRFVQNTDPGYNRSQVVSFYMPMNLPRSERIAAMLSVKEELRRQTGIEDIALVNQPLVSVGSFCSSCITLPGKSKAEKLSVAQLSTDADFANVMQLQLKQGRWFRDDNGADKRNVILNETAVAELGLPAAPVGMPFIFKGDTGQVIGVVKNFHFKSMHEKIGPLVAFNKPDWWVMMTARIQRGATTSALSAIRTHWKKRFPDSPLEYKFMDEYFDKLYKRDLQSSTLILLFSFIAIVISALGLFSLAAFAATQRTKEIGIRKVLGASVPGITRLLAKDFVKLVMIAIVIATPIAWWATHKWLLNFAYRISLSWWMFGLAGAAALAVAIATISFQSVRAARANPAASLRTE